MTLKKLPLKSLMKQKAAKDDKLADAKTKFEDVKDQATEN